MTFSDPDLLRIYLAEKKLRALELSLLLSTLQFLLTQAQEVCAGAGLPGLDPRGRGCPEFQARPASGRNWDPASVQTAGCRQQAADSRLQALEK